MLQWLMVITIFFLSEAAFAALTVVKDFGNTVSTAPYFKTIAVPNKKTLLQTLQDQKTQFKPVSIDENQLLYPNPSEFMPGPVKKRKLNIAHIGNIAFFIIGPDKASVKWAKQNAAYFKKIHAIGMVTNIESAKQAQKIEQATGLHLIPAHIAGLSEIIGVKHYPFLIAKHWIVQ